VFLDKGRNINVLSFARLLMFGSRDVWFEIALPVFLRNTIGWAGSLVGLVMGGYIVIYGGLQTQARLFLRPCGCVPPKSNHIVPWTILATLVRRALPFTH